MVTSPPFKDLHLPRPRQQEEAERAHRAEVRLDQTISELRKVQLSCEETGDAWGPWGPWGPPVGAPGGPLGDGKALDVFYKGFLDVHDITDIAT